MAFKCLPIRVIIEFEHTDKNTAPILSHLQKQFGVSTADDFWKHWVNDELLILNYND